MLFLGLIVLLIVVIIYLNQRKKPLYTEEELSRYITYNTYHPTSQPVLGMWETFKSNPKMFDIEVKYTDEYEGIISVCDIKNGLKFVVSFIYGLTDTGYKYVYWNMEGLACLDTDELNWLCSMVWKHKQKAMSRLERLREFKRSSLLNAQKQKYIDLYCK
jgi:hypothetical protein